MMKTMKFPIIDPSNEIGVFEKPPYFNSLPFLFILFTLLHTSDKYKRPECKNSKAGNKTFS